MDLTPLFEYCRAAGIPLAGDQEVAFNTFASALKERNSDVNLTRVPEELFAVRHFVDSLLVQEFVPLGSHVLDIGTGPGFPSWPLACVRPDLRVTGMDSSGKMLAFLSEHPLPNLETRLSRAEVRADTLFDVVTGRAVAPLAVQVELSANWVKEGGTVVLFRTPPEESACDLQELPRLGLILESLNLRELPNGQGSRLFPVYRKVGRSESRIPRKWAEMKKRPLQ